jgi:hypothetical protein
MSEIHYFPRYSQPENVITNNTLLLLLRLYDYDRFKFARFLRSVLADDADVSGAIGLQIRQQQGTGATVADGFLAQASIKIIVETKRSNDAFRLDQLRGHLKGFGNEEFRLLVLLSPDDSVRPDAHRPILEEAKSRGVTVVLTSFEAIIEAARGSLPDHDEELKALVEDFAAFCSEAGLLPTDHHTVFVPPCGQSFAENVEFRLYYCPATRFRRRTAYLGIYKDKAVQWVGHIAKVVACAVELESGLVTPAANEASLTPEETRRIVGATRAAKARWNVDHDHQFFLCDEFHPTSFRKISSGGMFGHRYFDLNQVLGKVPPTLELIAAGLQDKTWE